MAIGKRAKVIAKKLYFGRTKKRRLTDKTSAEPRGRDLASLHKKKLIEASEIVAGTFPAITPKLNGKIVSIYMNPHLNAAEISAAVGKELKKAFEAEKNPVVKDRLKWYCLTAEKILLYSKKYLGLKNMHRKP